MAKIIIGIDPGQKGALWYLDSKKMPHYCNMLVDKNKDVNPIKLKGWLSGFTGCEVICYLERPIAMPKQGVRGTGTTFFNYGQMVAVIRLLEYEIVEVIPDEWKQGLFGDPKAPKIKGIALIERLYPDLELPKNKEKCGGIADAGCIARYGTLLEE